MRVFGAAPKGDEHDGEPRHSIPDLAEALQQQWGGKSGVTEAVPIVPVPLHEPTDAVE